MRGGIADSATGRRFSRSPLMSERQHRRVERRAARVGLRAELEPLDAIGAAAAAARCARASAAGGRLLEHDADDLALELGAARHDRDRAGADRELARLLDVRPLRVAEIVQPIDSCRSVSDWPRRSSSGRAKTRGSDALRARRAAARRSAARSVT